MFDDTRRIAVIREVTAGTPAEPMLLAETWADDVAERCFVGYFPADRLRLAADVVDRIPARDGGCRWLVRNRAGTR
ncbi:MAG: hypothetical protein ACRDT9_11175 [Agromyces sp.]